MIPATLRAQAELELRRRKRDGGISSDNNRNYRELALFSPFPGPQIAAYESQADELFFGGAAGGGKLLSLDTPLPTPDGWTTMGEVQVGDRVFDERGGPCTVLAVSALQFDTTYRLHFSDGATIVAGASHQWVTETYGDRSKQHRRSDEYREHRRATRPQRGIGKKPWLAEANAQRDYVYLDTPEPTVKTTQEIVDTLYVRGSRLNHSIRVSGALALPEADLLISPYVLGAWLGDGTTTSGAITGIDPDIYAEVGKAGYVITDYAVAKTKGILGLRKQLRQLGVFGNKHIPQAYLRASIDQRLALLQGLMDTDGYCDPRGQCEFTTINRRLADQVQELIVSLGIKVTVTSGRATLNGKDCGEKYRLKFLTSLPAFRLSRKLRRQKRDGFRGTHDRRYIVAAEQVTPVLMRCITVNSPSHLYLAGREMIPTHNSFLLLGLALTAHKQSIIFRREHVQVKALEEESRKMLSGTTARYNGQDHIWRGIPGDRMLEFGGVPYEWNVDRYQGRPHDLLGFDEIPTFTENQYRFLVAWCRTTVPGQRCRIVATGNPPLDSEGEWVIRYWAPWLDPHHPNPAKPGELRWFARIDDKDVEVPDGSPIEHNGKRITPRSRTFIPARVEDNPLHMATGYDAVLDSLPEPLRSALREGNFNAVRADDPWQVIPTAWVQAAMKRWEQGQPPDVKMRAIGADVARGGKDKTAIAPLRGNWFEEVRTYPGAMTPDGPTAARYILDIRQDDADIAFDAVGIGAGVQDALRALNVEQARPVNAGAASDAHDKSGRYGFTNLRAEMYWRFREALDPASGEGVALPPDRELLADLCSAKYKVVGARYQIEAKDDIKKRIGRSPDKGDAVVMAWHQASTGLLMPFVLDW